MIAKQGSAVWSGGLRDGRGRVSTESGVLNEENYDFAKRFADEAGTNPEELLGAAHAACFSMALANILGDSGMVADEISTTATVTLDPKDAEITKVHLEVRAKIPDADGEAFLEAAEAAKAGCPVSKLFRAEITLDAKLA